MNFERNIDPHKALSLGGYSFDSLRIGAILQSIKNFGVTKEEGKLRHINSCHLQLPKGCFLLITSDVTFPIGSNKKIFGFVKYLTREDFEIPKSQEDYNIIFKNKFTWRKIGVIWLTKRQFDNRLKIIKPGYEL